MPKGAKSQDYNPCHRFVEYMASHGESWVKFINGHRGREARNGSIRLVTGYDKSTSWGMAAFWNNPEICEGRLQFLSHSDSDPAYSWNYTGIADHEVQSGPLGQENEDLGATLEQPLLNQTLFVRTLSLSLSKQLWTKVNPRSGVKLASHSRYPGASRTAIPSGSSNGSRGSGRSSLSSSFASSGASLGQGSRTVFSRNWPGSSDEADEDGSPQTDSDESLGEFPNGELPVSVPSTTKIFIYCFFQSISHPASIVNDFLLQIVSHIKSSLHSSNSEVVVHRYHTLKWP